MRGNFLTYVHTSVGAEGGDLQLLDPLFEWMLLFVGTPYRKSEGDEYGASIRAWVHLNHALRFICTGLVSSANKIQTVCVEEA